MSKISYSKLALDKNTESKVIKINEQEVEVLSYVPTLEKKELIEASVMKSMEGSFVNPVLLDAYFHMFLVLSYTNIYLTPAQSEKMLEVYDSLERNEVVNLVINSIPEVEYNALKDSLNVYVEKVEKYKSSLVGIVQTLTDNLVEAESVLEGFNLEENETVQSLIAIAKDNGVL